MQLEGSVEEIIFRNDENGYSVLVVDCNNELVTAVGIFPPLGSGETLQMQGEWLENKRFGQQFSVEKVKVVQPNSEETIIKYLSSGLFKGVGEHTAAGIVEMFGLETLDIIEFQPIKLSKIKGISTNKAMLIGETFKELKDMQAVIMYLQNYDIGLNLAIKIYRVYGKSAGNILETNPYKLVDEIDGVGFVTADQLAVKIGIKSDSKFRVSSGICYALRETASMNGNTYLPKEKLFGEVSKLLKLNLDEYADLLNDCVAECVVQGKIVEIKNGEEKRIMLSKFYNTEMAIALKLIRMIKNCDNISLNLDVELTEYEKINKIQLHESQKKAIENCISYGVNVITGGPGTGKTTIIKCIMEILTALGKKVCLCAPTGRASKRLAEATGETAKTIHRMLDLDFKDGKGFFTYNESSKLDADIVIVDEVSMCDEYVFNALISAIPTGGRLIMVGDKDQLPSVGAGNVLADVIASGLVSVNCLTRIYRQGDESTIIENAHKINHGEMPILDNKSADFFFDNQVEQGGILKNTIDMVTSRIPKFANVKSSDIQVLCPMKKGLAGVENMNVQLQDALNPLAPDKPQITIGSNGIFRKGDKVIHMVNNYQMEWLNKLDNSAGAGVFNGDIGYIVDVFPREPSLVVEFEDGKVAKYAQSDFEQLALAYAISIHKSQGSEFSVALIAIAGGSYMIMTRNLLYTAVTRAKNMVVIVGNRDSVEKMVKNNFTEKRYSMLADMLQMQSKLQSFDEKI
ncbi:MAG: ATP-dependent RecD-like DNA helicase [Clostridia bacterium]